MRKGRVGISAVRNDTNIISIVIFYCALIFSKKKMDFVEKSAGNFKLRR